MKLFTNLRLQQDSPHGSLRRLLRKETIKAFGNNATDVRDAWLAARRKIKGHLTVRHYPPIAVVAHISHRYRIAPHDEQGRVLCDFNGLPKWFPARVSGNNLIVKVADA